MAYIQGSTNPNTPAEVGSAAAMPLHITPKPIPYDAYGHYALDVQTGALAAGGGSNQEVLQFRWTDTTRKAIIQRIQITGMRATTAFAVGTIDIKATRCTSFSVAGTGGSTITLTNPALALRSTFTASLASEIRYSSSTAPLGGGTKTLDTIDLGQITTHSSGGVGSATPIIGSIYLPIYDLFVNSMGDGEHPLVLGASEGFVIRVSVPATGVWNIGMRVKWMEAAAF